MFRFIRFIARIILFPFFRVKVIGNREIKDGSLIISNHISFADPIVIICALKRPVWTMAKKELFANRLSGAFFRSIHSFPVDRKGNDLGAMKTTVSLLKENKSVLIFPQGTRIRGKRGDATEIKGGIGLIATHTGVDIVPVSVYNKGYRRGFLKRTVITVGEPVTSEEYTRSCGDGRTLIARYAFGKVVDQLKQSEELFGEKHTDRR